MGDVAMTVPVLRAFVKQHPNVKVTMVSRPFFKPFFDGIPNVDFFPVDLKMRHKGIFGLFKLYFDLRKNQIDAFADLHQVLRSKIVRYLFAMSGKAVAGLDKGRAEKKALTRSENKIFKQLKPTVGRYADVFRALGFALDLSNPEFPQKRTLSDEVLSVTGKKSGNWIGIAPFAAHQPKQYPIDLMLEVVRNLSENPANTIFLFGAGTQEIQILEILKSDKENVIVIAGKFTFSQETDLISNLDLMLSMDSANGHIAAMFGVQTVTLWGATHPFAGFAPFHQPESNLMVSNREKFPLLPTSVYGNRIVEGYEDAMRTITSESVVEKINAILSNSATSEKQIWQDEIEFIDYSDDLKSYIKILNYEWLEKYFRVEPGDEKSLSNPKEEIIDKGGYIWFVKFRGQIVGTVSLLKKRNGDFELGKMAVTEKFQGFGIGKMMIEHSFKKAKELGIPKLILYSNTKLESAIHLYRKFGFREIELEPGLYERADIKMEVRL